MKLVTMILAGVMFSACGKDKDESGESSEGVTAPFLTVDDLAPKGVFRALGSSDIERMLKAEPTLYLHGEPPAESAEDQEESQAYKCIESAFNDIAIQGDSSHLALGFEIDVTSCFPEFNQEGVEASIVSKNYWRFTCEGVDLSPHVGKKVGELGAPVDQFLDGLTCQSETFLLHSRRDAILAGALHSTKISYQGDASGGPCASAIEGNVERIQDGCLKIERAVDYLSTNRQPGEDYTRFEANGLVAELEESKAFYTSGSWVSQIHDWKGEVRYDGADVAPVYVMSKLQEQIFGFLNGGYSLQFVGPATVVENACTKFELELLSPNKERVVAAFDMGETVFDANSLKIYADAACEVEQARFPLNKGESSIVLFAKTKTDASYLDFQIVADPPSGVYFAGPSIEGTVSP